MVGGKAALHRTLQESLGGPRHARAGLTGSRLIQMKASALPRGAFHTAVAVLLVGILSAGQLTHAQGPGLDDGGSAGLSHGRGVPYRTAGRLLQYPSEACSECTDILQISLGGYCSAGQAL